MILVKESSAKESRGRRDWRQEVVTQRMARGRKREGGSVFRERVRKRTMYVGKMERKTERDGEWPSVGMMGERVRRDARETAVKHSMENAARRARGKRRERDTKTGVVAAVHTSS